MLPANEFAPVANLTTYETLLEEGVLGDYHLLIATEVDKDPAAWKEFWLVASDPTPPFIILDNGLIETGAAANFDLIERACDAVNPDCVVLPDVLGNFIGTMHASRDALPQFRELHTPLMGVVQGQTPVEVSEIIKFYVDSGVEYLSIPRVMVNYFETRRWLVEKARWTGKPVHLLGWSDNVRDDLQCAAMDGVMGIDSAVPLWWTERFPIRPPSNADFGKRPADYWTLDMDPESWGTLLYNVRWTRKWIGQFVQDARTVGAE